MLETRTKSAEAPRSRGVYNPGLALAAVLAVAMGVGLNAAIFSGSLQSPGFNGLTLTAEVRPSGAGFETEKVGRASAVKTATTASDRGASSQVSASRPLASAASSKKRRLSLLWNKPGGDSHSQLCLPILEALINTSTLRSAHATTEDMIKRAILGLFREMPLADKNRSHLCGD